MSTTKADVFTALCELQRPYRRPESTCRMCGRACNVKMICARALAFQMERPIGSISTLLSKLSAYGQIERVKMPGYRCRFLYQAKEARLNAAYSIASSALN